MAYFSTTKKGEIQELREGISSTNIKTKKDSVKRVIGAMMAGTDVSSLLPAVLVNMQTTDLELKKLIYLYLVNYSKSEPELAIHAVNTFVKDAEDPNPLVRALALRTMGQIRIEQITEYMCEPLHRCLKDNDPYVKKTAVLGVAKMYDINAQLVEDEGFIEMLHDLLGDGNPMVVSNSVATLAEIQVSRPEQIILEITSDVLQKLVSALSQASEWGQVHILDALALWYTPETSSEAERIVERVALHLNHNNSAVVLSATKVIVKLTESIKDTAIVDKLMKKLTQPLVSLLSSFPEVRYVALRNLNLIVQRLPDLLVNEINIFFCKYNDPIYVKMEKLEILMLLVNEQNVSQVLNELKEYATEVDIDFVRKAVSAIGRCAILLPGAAGLCVDTLVHLVETSQVNFVIQEAIIVIKDVFRRYPNKYESIIGKLCAKLESLDEPEAKASMIWILGEYADRIENADKVLESYFLETFADEPPVVQMAILTASVKIFLAIPASQPMVQSVLKIATKKTDNPDLRDRGFIYWRLLASSKELAKSVLKAKKPPISAQKDLVSKDVLADLFPYLGTLSSVLHKVPEHVMTVHRPSNLANIPMPGGNAPEEEVTVGRTEEAPQQSLDDIKPSEALEAQQKDEEDLIDLGVFGLGSGSAPPVDSSGLVDLTMLASMMGAPAPAKQSAVDFNTLPQLTQHQSGVSIFGKLIQNNQKPALFLRFRNASNTPITNVDLRFNVNAFALKAQPANLAPYPVQPGQQRDVTIACDFDPAQLKVTGPDIQVGIQCDVGMVMFLLRGKVLSLIQHGTDVNFGKTKAASVKGRVASTVVNGCPGVNPVVQKLVGFGFVETNRMTRDGIEAVQLYGQVPPLTGHIVIEMMFKGGQAHCNSRSEPDYLAGMLGDELGQELP